jgi:hypothetical protein
MKAAIGPTQLRCLPCFLACKNHDSLFVFSKTKKEEKKRKGS